MIKQSKLPDNKILYSDERTNDPIAIATVTDASRYQKHKKNYMLEWHPTMQHLYPATTSLSRMNMGQSTSATDAISNVQSQYSMLTENPDQGDPLKATLVSPHVERTMPVPGHDQPQKFEYSQYHLHDPETDKPVASLYINNKMIKHMGTDHSFFNNGHQRAYPHSFVEYGDEKPTVAQQKILEVKHSGVDPISQMKRVKTWLETRHTEPTFIGERKHEGAFYYNHKQTPEDAVSKYLNHISSQYGTKDVNFDTVAPGLAIGIKPTNQHNTGVYHVIDARQPGKLMHITRNLSHESSYKSEPLNDVID